MNGFYFGAQDASVWTSRTTPVALEVFSDIKHVLREDTGLDLNDKTKILVKGISAAESHTATQ